MRDFFLPTTDAGVLGQLAVFALVWGCTTIWSLRRDSTMRLLVFGLGLTLFGLMGFRAMH